MEMPKTKNLKREKDMKRILCFLAKHRDKPLTASAIAKALNLQGGRISIYLELLEAQAEIKRTPIGNSNWGQLVELVE
jgi:predicted AAA+ superfamily ATPase